MDASDVLALRFEEHRAHLKTVAYRMLGSLSEADDAVQESWLRLSRTDTSEIENLGGWLTTVVARVCLDMLRSRERREEPVGERLPDPVVVADAPGDPEREAMLADSVGLAMMVVLDTLAPAERLAFVLHDMFAVPFEEIAPIVERAPSATRQLASRARRRVQGVTPVPDGDVSRQRKVVNAFLAAARGGDFEALVAVLDPSVVQRAATLGHLKVLRGAAAVAEQAMTFARVASGAYPVLINGAAGVVAATPDGRPFSLLAFTIVDDRIVEMYAFAGPELVDEFVGQRWK
ncbi:sigma-70 family RNA polymerase sigma factor [Nonomuraea africana]|uniref:RNA polymerase sigma-70 factor (ECF subfamily) n=1 Tax=Nonomuraea africana TaxID=46171 RepID=A0ABR9KQK3_9ACTN|nr:sigma-70 family RNA polymerase sigma factor [Nonomuraea africana]MBE1564289.1 RNA polymerase sigma-70 factor (ECF subfamily) [Nonomuraea africana]